MTDLLVHVTQCAPYESGPAGVHRVLPQTVDAMAEIAELCGLGFVHVPDVRRIDPAQLAATRVLSLFTIGETPWDPAQRGAILDQMRAGRTGVVAIHSATDSCHGWGDYGALVGARFDGHPWTTSFEAEVVVPEHPAVAHLGATWSWHDEVYQFRDLRADAEVLLRVPEDQLDLDVPGVMRRAHGFPVSWCFTEGEGRAFSTSLGHFPEAWESIVYLRHLRGGTEWVLGSQS
jgi:type 1 glutamine amidotransferase